MPPGTNRITSSRVFGSAGLELMEYARYTSSVTSSYGSVLSWTYWPGVYFISAGSSSSKRNSFISCVRSVILATRQVNSLMLNSSSGMRMAISRRILTWQLRRTLSLRSAGSRNGSSVGSSGPAPSSTFTLQYPQVPLPPQALGIKIFSATSVPSSEPPPLTVSCFSSLIVTVHAP